MPYALFCILLNASAGIDHTHADALKRAFHEAGGDAVVAPIRRGEDLTAVAKHLLEKKPAALVAAGGDGTISAVASAVRGTDTPLGIVPCGTFNHFAKDLGLPLDAAGAARVIVAGKRRAVDVGEVNGNCFINNASLGLYPGIVKERTRQQRRLRRSKRAAMLWATLAALDRPPLLDLHLEIDGEVRDCRAPFVFVGNNDYLLDGFNIGRRGSLDCGVLTVYTTRSCTSGGLIALAFRALLGRLRQADDFVESSANTLCVRSRHRRLLVAMDGEVSRMATPLEFRIVPRSLQVLVP